ncbi:MAG: MaoC/PaaZ C-terminal domain-containing protein [Myxococcales bacterium]|nr:MaoC/PaaZ C-terminal domain-containing protein [Polyangiaceae bacterium]MDW8251434.1 MaoC/PaaZ C-terminal domain-containing protein [Myxococcales bacterium]
MTVPFHLILAQGPVLAALGRVTLSSIIPARRGSIKTPGPWMEDALPPRPAALIDAYLRHVGGEPEAYRGVVPPHLFPQWCFPLIVRSFAGLPYRMVRALNAGCVIESRTPLPAGKPLRVRARLTSVDDNGQRALITHEILTGTTSCPEALRAELRAYVPLAMERDGRARKARPVVPPGAHQLAVLRLDGEAGLEFAKLTGDFNPIHWLRPYARASGFRGPILHGFSAFARAIEAINRALLGGDPRGLRRAEAHFLRPLLLPAEVGIYAEGGSFFVGDAAGAKAYLEGTWEPR